VPQENSELTKVISGGVSSARNPQASPDASAVGLSLAVGAFRHHWYWTTPIGIALAIAGMVLVYANFVPMFQAKHLLEANQGYIVFDKAMKRNHSNLVATERQVIQSDIVLDEVLAMPEIQALGMLNQEESKDELKKNTTISTAGAATLFQIAYDDPDPTASAIICNAITNAFLQQRKLLDDRRVGDLEAWLTPSIDQWKSQVEGHDKRITELSKSTLGFDPDNPVEVLEFDIASLANARAKLQELRVEEAFMEMELSSEVERGPSPDSVRDVPQVTIPEPTNAELDRYVAAATSVVKQRARLSEKEGILRSLENNGLKALRSEYYEQIQQEAKDIESELTALEKSTRLEGVKAIRKEFSEAAKRRAETNLINATALSQEEKASKRQALASAKAKRALLEVEYDREREKLERKGGNTVELMFAKEDRELAAGLLSQMQSRLAAIKVERRRGSGIQSIAPAKPPRKPVEPLPYRNLILAGLLGLFAPAGLAVFFEYRSQRICDAKALESKTSAPIIGEVARLPSSARSVRKQRVFEESIDTLRANLMLSKDSSTAKTIAVVSSMSGEGKSSVSSQLAISLAKACGTTVLLIDADLRSPDQHDIFGIDMGPGLAGVLAKDTTLEDAVDESLGELVHVLPAGRMTMSPHRLLSSTGTRALLDQALERYSYVVIDTAPVLAAGETLAIASEADATLLCAMRDVTRGESILRSTRRLEAAGSNIVGTVFSGVPTRQYSYRYGDYRYLTAHSNA